MAILDLIAQPEDVAVGPVGSVSFAGSGDHFTNGYFATNSSYSFRLKTALAAPQTTLWFHARTYDSNGAVSDGTKRVRFVDSGSGDSQIELTRGSTINSWRVKRRSSGSLVNVGGEFTVAQNVWFNLDLEYIPHATTGVMNVYVDDVLVEAFTGNTAIDAGDWDDVIFESEIYDNLFYGEIMISNTSTVGSRLAALHPGANGTHTDWTGNYYDIEEVDYVATDFVSTNSANQYTSFVMGDTPGALSGKNVAHVRLNGTIFGDGSLDVKPLLRIGSTTYEGTTFTMASGLNRVITDYLVSPATSGAFTVSEVNGMEAGFKSV